MSIRRIMRNKKFRRFIRCLSSLKDKRQKGKVKHPIEGCLVIIILAMLSGCNYFREFILFASKHESKLRKLNLIPNGLPSHDTLERIVHKIDKLELNHSLVALLFPSLKNRPIISIDGKNIRATRDRSLSGCHQGMKDIVTMYLAESKISLLSYNNLDKGNEKNVIPVLLKMFYDYYPNVKPFITIDAIAVTNEILTLLNEYEYDFVIAYKTSKGILKELDSLLTSNEGAIKDITANSSRIETRTFNLYSPFHIVGIERWLPYISHIGKMNTKIIDNITGELKEDRFYYLTSNITHNEFKNMRRKHWSIENSLHWVLDNSFKEDRMRMKKGHASENMNLLRKFVLNVLALTNCASESVSASRDELKYDTPQKLLYKIMTAVA